MERRKEGNGEGERSNTSPSCCLLLAVGRFVKRGVLEEKPENVLAAGARTSPPSAGGPPSPPLTALLFCIRLLWQLSFLLAAFHFAP